MSTMISACIVGGLSRLTWSAEKGYTREDMQCPEMAREYNQEGMGGGDSNDRMKLNKRTSCEMNLISRRWDWRLFWGIMDIALLMLSFCTYFSILLSQTKSSSEKLLPSFFGVQRRICVDLKPPSGPPNAKQVLMRRVGTRQTLKNYLWHYLRLSTNDATSKGHTKEHVTFACPDVTSTA